MHAPEIRTSKHNRVQPASFRESHSTPESRRVSVGSAHAQRLSLASSPHSTPHTSHGNSPSQPFNPLIYGNDVDSVDIATRVAMVSLLKRYKSSYFILYSYTIRLIFRIY